MSEINTAKHEEGDEERFAKSAKQTEDRFVASLLLSGVGDAMGFRNRKWEFCTNGQQIKDELDTLGGVKNLDIRLPDWRVSDDTVMHLATAEGMVEACSNDDNAPKTKIYKTIAAKYIECMKDMSGRAPGPTCMRYIGALKPAKEGGLRNAFNPRGGGCGAAMRAMCIGLRYPRPEQLQDLIEVSIETGRMSHHHPTGYLGALAAALFTAYALQDKPLTAWGKGLLDSLEDAKQHIEREGRFEMENLKAWPYFENKWSDYLKNRQILDGKTEPVFPKKYGVAEREAFYESISFDGWGGSSGHDAPLIAYDALLGAKGDWVELCERGMLHGGDSDSTGVMAGAWYGAMHGLEGVPECNYQKLEYRDRLERAGRALYAIHSRETSARTFCDEARDSFSDNTTSDSSNI